MRFAALLFLIACSSKSPNPTGPSPSPSPSTAPVAGACIKTGCSATICAEAGNDQMSTCEYKPEYACYQAATCEKQPDGKCGWTQTDTLKACLAKPPQN